MEWISADDRLPEKSGVYIVFDGKEVSVYLYRPSYNTFISTGITHWMPLPDQPKRIKQCNMIKRLLRSFLKRIASDYAEFEQALKQCEWRHEQAINDFLSEHKSG